MVVVKCWLEMKWSDDKYTLIDLTPDCYPAMKHVAWPAGKIGEAQDRMATRVSPGSANAHKRIFFGHFAKAGLRSRKSPYGGWG